MVGLLAGRVAFVALQNSMFKYERPWAMYSSVWLKNMQGL